MPTKNPNSQGKADSDEAKSPENQEETTAGDILEQLKSESASTSNLYKLEQKMFKTITNLDKNMTKQQKMLDKAKKNLDSMSTALSSISHDTGEIKTTLSSVDTSLRQVLVVLEQIQSSGGLGSGYSGSGNAPNLNPGLSSLEQKIDQEYRRIRQLQAEHDAGDLSESEFQDLVDDIQQNIEDLTDKIEIANATLASAARDYNAYLTAAEKFEQDKAKAVDDFSVGAITADDLARKLSDLRDIFDAHNKTLAEAENTWKDDGKFRFAKEAEDIKRSINEAFDAQKEDLTERFERGLPNLDGTILDNDSFMQAMLDLEGQRATAMAHASGISGMVTGVDSIEKVGVTLDKFIDKFSSGTTYDAKTGKNTTASEAVEAVGSIAGTLAGEEVGAAIGTAIGGPVGTIVGGIVGNVIGQKIEALSSLIGDRLDYLANHSKKTRDEILKAGFEKIRNDMKDIATYSIEIYETATKDIYAAWDKNLAQITATQGYTKEALNSLQDAVAQRLQAEGYGTTIDASQYLDQLANTLNASLSGTLAESFAAQNLILQKAVPEIDLSASAAQFAAIFANANKETGMGEETMIAAMNEIAGAAKALESVTEGNNQFLKETSNLLSKATEVVNIAGGNADQISGLTTQMMASEAAITSVAPQLSGFTSELVSVLMNNNDSTAVALRAIMNDMNRNIGVSATSFMQSFMEDTQGTLSTAFAAIQRFIDQNENEASRQEFLHAMESVFGVQGSKLAQIDFGSVADMIDQVNTSVNMAALTNAENLVKSGETTTVEEQLLANSTNQLLATNAISSTIDNKLMRKLESNELAMERLVYQAQATQSVDLAENTLTFFTRLGDLIMSILDPLGLFDMLTTSLNATTSSWIDAERYLVTSTMSAVGSTVADSSAAQANTLANTIGGATAVMLAAETKSTDAMVEAVESSGVTQTFENMMNDYSAASKEAQAAVAASSAESNIISYAAMEQQARQSSEYQRKQDEAKAQEARYEEEKAAAREQQRLTQEEESIRNLENHDNIVIIRDALDSLDMAQYLEPILEEERVHTDQFKVIQEHGSELVKLLSTIIEYNMNVSPEFASTISYDERARIMDNGYINSGVSIM